MIEVISDLIDKQNKVLKKPALIFDGRKISYAELRDRTDKLAKGLIKLGIEKGDKIGILLRNCPEYVISLFGIIKAGAIVVPLNFMLKEEELKPILEEAEIKLVISSSEFLSILERLRLRIECFNFIVLIDEEKKEEYFYSLLEKQRVEKIELPKLSRDELCVLIYTSGTTGIPKGVMLSHRNFISNIEACLEVINFSARERVICILPLFHSFTLTVCLFLPLYLGSCILLFATVRSLGKVLKGLVKYRGTIFIGIPQIYKVMSDFKMPWLLKIPVIRKFIFPLKLCISGAAPLPGEVLTNFQKKFKIPLLEGYGLTEASPVVSINPPYKVKPGSVGLPLPGIEVKVVNDKGEELSRGEEGELILKGENVMLGYYKQEEETKKVIKDGWLYTGDIAKIDEEGYIYILDRKKDLIIVRGLNVYPREVEEVIYQNPKVKEVCVVGIPDESRGEVPKAFVVVKEGEELTAKELLEFLRPRLAGYKIPRYIEFRDELPKSPSGKILRKELKDKI
ncbi:MAG: fatty acid--CoA ligase [Candidatus Omnitrophota bacterium]|nr:MAG: fatty acid--CoA ligase [Candidatus Omnitrophota bacterium]